MSSKQQDSKQNDTNTQSWQEWSSVNSNSTNEYATPAKIWRPFDRVFDGFDLDPCSGAEPQPIAETRYTRQDDGLSQSWFGDAWVNPPYSDPSAWWEKAIDEYNQGNAERILLLIPARTNTNYFDKYRPQSDLICFFDHKVQFLQDGEKAKDYLPTPVMMVYIGDVTEAIVDAMNQFGWVVDCAEDTVTLSDF